MNKKNLTKADIRTKFITPAFVGANGEKWEVMTQISTRQVQLLPFAHPLLAEQQRIVAKVDQLMALVDELET